MSGLPPALLSGLELAETPAGTRLRVRVKPGAREAAILGVHGGALKVAVQAPPERGKANRALVRLLLRALELAPGDVQLVAGASAQDKTLFVALPPAALRQRLAAPEP